MILEDFINEWSKQFAIFDNVCLIREGKTQMKGNKQEQINNILKSAKNQYFLAPMFQVNDLPFRKMCRKHGVNLCWTGMINSHMWLINPKDRPVMFETCEDDRPIIAQLNGNDENELLSCAQDIEPLVDAIDLNLGCTQHIARRGQYGYFMVNTEEKRQNVIQMVENLTSKISIPVTAKIRLLANENSENDEPDIKLTTYFAKCLEKAGISLISVHGRQKRLNKAGSINTEAIRDIVNSVKIPVVANGGITSKREADILLKETGAAAVMIGQGLLENPLMFDIKNSENINQSDNNKNDDDVNDNNDYRPNPVEMAREYLALYRERPTVDFFVARRHIFYFFDKIIRTANNVADILKKTHTVEQVEDFLRDYEEGKLVLQTQEQQQQKSCEADVVSTEK